MTRILASIRKYGAVCAVAIGLGLCVVTAAFADGPNGAGKLPPPSEGTLQSDGSVVYTSGIVLLADKRIAWHDIDNTVWTPTVQYDGSWLYQDGTVLYTDGTVTYN